MRAPLPAHTEAWQIFEEMHRSQADVDPYPGLAALRRRAPVVEGSAWELLGYHTPEAPTSAPRFTALSYEAAERILRDHETFSSSVYASTMGLIFGHSILEMDEPEHRAYRGIIQKAFTRRALERWREELIRPVVSALLDAVSPAGRAELVRDLAFPFPIQVIAVLLDLPQDAVPRFHRWAGEIISLTVDWQRALRASQESGEFFRGLVAERRRRPGEDLISLLATASLDGQRLEDDEVVAFLRLLTPAGAETTYRSSANLLYGLLTHPEQLEAVRADPSLIPRAVEEALRWEPPLLVVDRLALRDAEVCGVRIPAGALVSVNLGSANRDETVWESPDRFDIRREPKPHVSFAAGVHTCLGIHLAKLEMQVMLETLLGRLPRLRLDPGAPPPRIRGLVFRAADALPVLFD